MKLKAESTVFNDERIAEDISNAQATADETAQYFWFVGTGTDTGVHITEKPQEQFREDPENGGGNLLARSNGIAIRDGLEELAVFGSTARVGKDSDYNVQLDGTGISLNSGDEEVFKISSEVDGYGEKAKLETSTDGATALLEFNGWENDDYAFTILNTRGGTNPQETTWYPYAELRLERDDDSALIDISAYKSSPREGGSIWVSAFAQADSSHEADKSYAGIHANVINFEGTNSKILLQLDNYSSSSDYPLYQAIVALGWQNDVIE